MNSLEQRETDRVRGTGLFAFAVGFLATLPILSLFSFYSCVLLARVAFGYWPRCNQPDPGTIGTEPLAACIVVASIALLVCCVSPAILLALLVTLRRSLFSRPYVTKVWVYLISFFILLLLARIDPGGFFDWFFD